MERLKLEWRDYRAGLAVYPVNETATFDEMWQRAADRAGGAGMPAPVTMADVLILMLFEQEIALRALRSRDL